MGACTFSDLIVVKGDHREAYREAREEANDYNGHQEGYSGDIQTTNGYSITSSNPRFGTKSFNKWEDKKLDSMDKGDCLCIEIEGSVATRIKQSRGYKGKKGIKVFYFFGWARC